MSVPENFQALQASAIAEHFAAERVNYLFIGRSGAILLGFPGITQDVDLFPEKSEENGRRIIAALEKLEFELDGVRRADIVRGKDFVQIKTGSFPLDLVFAPDGIDSFAAAHARSIENFPVASLDDIIASKRVSGREKHVDLPLLEDFRAEYESLHPKPLKSA